MPRSAAALLFAGSYTFWSQAVIAEVYALHLLLVASTLLLLLRWSRDPTHRRLCWFFAVYAVAFGNHLSMILLLPAYTTFLVASAPGGWRSLLSRRIVLAAAAAVTLGALQYAWNFSALWREVVPPAGFGEALRTFWFDVTKTDWRETMVLEVPAAVMSERLRMYAFDLAQQFGWVPPLAAAAGLVHLARTNWRRAALLVLIFATTITFALGYNVGDAYVFFLPSHLAVALLAAVGLVAWQRAIGPRLRPLVPGAFLALATWNIVGNYPALDRSADGRPTAVLTAMAEGLSDRNALLMTDMNWQLQNGLTYFGQYARPEVLHTWLPEVLLYAPALIRDNHSVGREIFATERAAGQLAAAYGPLFRIEQTRTVPTLEAVVGSLPVGTRYVLCVLKPTREFDIDYGDVDRAIRRLTGGSAPAVTGQDYVALAGRVGTAPVFFQGSNDPFRRRLQHRRRHGGRAHGIVAGVRHHQADGVRTRHCQPASQSHRGARHQLRGARRGWTANDDGVRRRHLRASAAIRGAIV